MLSKRFLASKTFHLICGPTRCIELTTALLERRADPAVIHPNGLIGTSMMKKPIIVWQPLPCTCTPSELPNFYDALKHVDVVSPNLADMNALFPEHVNINDPLNGLRIGCNRLLALGFGNRPSAVAVRCGEAGCYIATFHRHFEMPAYHPCPAQPSPEESSIRENKVVDPAGASHSFLGGFCIGLLSDPHPRGLNDFEVGGIYGSVAASFAIEQVGLPRVNFYEAPSRSFKKEHWNDEAVRKRLSEFERRLKIPPYSEERQQRASLYERFEFSQTISNFPGALKWGRRRKDK